MPILTVIWKERLPGPLKDPICNAPTLLDCWMPYPCPKRSLSHRKDTRTPMTLSLVIAWQIKWLDKYRTTSPLSPAADFEIHPHPDYSSKEAEPCWRKKGPEAPVVGWTLLNKPASLEHQAKAIISQIHNTLHIGPRALFSFLSPVFSPNISDRPYILFHRSCLTCTSTSPQGGLHPLQETHQFRDICLGRIGR